MEILKVWLFFEICQAKITIAENESLQYKAVKKVIISENLLLRNGIIGQFLNPGSNPRSETGVVDYATISLPTTH